MGARNKYLLKNVPVIWRQSIVHGVIYAHIHGQRTLVPSVSVSEAAKSFMATYNVGEDEMALSSIISVYNRIQREIFDEQKSSAA